MPEPCPSRAHGVPKYRGTHRAARCHPPPHLSPHLAAPKEIAPRILLHLRNIAQLISRRKAPHPAGSALLSQCQPPPPPPHSPLPESAVSNLLLAQMPTNSRLKVDHIYRRETIQKFVSKGSTSVVICLGRVYLLLVRKKKVRLPTNYLL